MQRCRSQIFGRILGITLFLVAAPALAQTKPTLFSLGSATPKLLAHGAQKSWPIKISEDQAMDAVFQGGMWLPNPSGGQIYAKYQRHILHPNGIWTWIGTVSTVHGDQSVVLTFGKGSVFGLIPQQSGYPLRIVTEAGQTRLIETTAAMAQSAQQLRLHSKQDYFIPPRVTPKALLDRQAAQAAAPAQVQATASGPVVIDVMVAFTPGFQSALGGLIPALTRIQNLVDLTNQAYVASNVNQQIRLVNTIEVNYPDNTSNDSALDDLTGIDGNGNTVPIPAALQGIASLRAQYGADLVTLIRSYNNSAQGSCGVGWLIGGNQTPIVPSQSYVYGYNVVSDGSNGGYYCLDTTFAHELGHNMGDAHDRANAGTGPNGNPIPGAYSYSFGYQGNGTNGFSTIMAYGTATTTPLSVFSNPNISTCQSTPCGVPDTASNSADNAHSMNNTASLIAAFEPTMVGNTSSNPYVHNDVNGDGKSDLLWYNASAGQLIYWLMSGPSVAGWQPFTVPGGYQPIATGDFDGNGYAEILWKSSKGEMYMWLSNGSSYTSQDVGPYPGGGVVLIGTGDLNGDGKTDLLWYNPSSGLMTYWLMNGSEIMGWQGIQTSSGLQPIAVGNFDGNNSGEVIWKTPAGEMYMWLFNASGLLSYYDIGPYPAGWVLASTGDVNMDGTTDLIWYNPKAGQVIYWLMNGPTIIGWQAIQTSSNLQPLATGVFDGTHAGLTWKTPGGGLYMWLFGNSSTAPLSYYSMGSYPAGWVPIP